jgi:hypothetical protein
MIFDFERVQGLSRMITVEKDPDKIDQYLSKLHTLLREELGENSQAHVDVSQTEARSEASVHKRRKRARP